MTIRLIGSVFAGLLTIAVLDNTIDAVMHGTGVFPPWGEPMHHGLFLLPLAYRAVDAVIGCTVAARLASDRPMRAALSVGAVGVVLSSLATIALWKAGPEFGPAWYPLALVAISLPCSWLGGSIEAWRRRTESSHRDAVRADR